MISARFAGVLAATACRIFQRKELFNGPFKVINLIRKNQDRGAQQVMVCQFLQRLATIGLHTQIHWNKF